jgi:hypothetical protein
MDKYYKFTVMFHTDNKWHSLLCNKDELKQALADLTLLHIQGTVSEFYYFKNSRNIIYKIKKLLQKIFQD